MACLELGRGAGLAAHRVPTNGCCGQLLVPLPDVMAPAPGTTRVSPRSLTTSETLPSSPVSPVLKFLVCCLASLPQAVPGPFWKTKPF